MFLIVSVALICLVLYLKKIILLKMCILYCPVLLNSILFYNLVCFDLVSNASSLICFRTVLLIHSSVSSEYWIDWFVQPFTHRLMLFSIYVTLYDCLFII